VGKGQLCDSFIVPEDTPVANYGFDITPHQLVTAYLTEKGIKINSEKLRSGSM